MTNKEESKRSASPPGNYCIHMSGLPFRATVDDIKQFFLPESECSNARILNNGDGRPSGDAIAAFDTESMAEKAMAKNRENLGSRFVVLTKQYKRSESILEDRTFSVHLAGLPFRVSEQAIKDWFLELADAECSSVRFILNVDGKKSGMAIAEFESEEMAEKAMMNQKKYIENRFVVLTRKF